MQKLKVGEKYPGNYKIEGPRLEYGENGFTLGIFLPDITKKEAESFQKGRYKFALTEISGILFFLYEFKPSIPISDTPFHFGLYTDNRIEQLPRELKLGEGLALSVIAVDTRSGTVRALRLIGLSTQFSRKLIDICLRQHEEGVDQSSYSAEIDRIQKAHTSRDLLKISSVYCKGD